MNKAILPALKNSFKIIPELEAGCNDINQVSLIYLDLNEFLDDGKAYI